MSQVGQSNADTAVVVPPADAGAPPPAATNDAPPVAPPAPAVSAPPAGDQPPRWALERIDRLTAEKKELERRNAELSVKQGGSSADSPASSSPPTPAIPAVPPAPIFDAAEIDRRAQALAEQRLAAQQFDRTVNEIAQNGLKEFPNEWQNGVQNLMRAQVLTPDAISAISELGNGHQIVMALSKDMNEATRIAALPTEAARGAALAKFASKLGDHAQANISRAPAPASTEVGGNTPSTSRSDKDSTDEWIRKRKAEKMAARG